MITRMITDTQKLKIELDDEGQKIGNSFKTKTH